MLRGEEYFLSSVVSVLEQDFSASHFLLGIIPPPKIVTLSLQGIFNSPSKYVYLNLVGCVLMM